MGVVSTSLPGRAGRTGAFVGRSLWRRLVFSMRTRFATEARRRALLERARIESAEDAARLLGGMKGAMMKLGQLASFASEAVPESARVTLRALQADAPPMAFALVRGVIEAELGGRLEDHFASFEPEPLAAASIGQVHRARLPDGTAVAVKVQYPGVDAAIRADLRTAGVVGFFAGLSSPNLDSDAVLEELTELLERELDYRVEAAAQQAFEASWREHPLIHVPRVHPSHSTARVLCQELVEGLGFYDFLAVATVEERRLAALTISDFVFDALHLEHRFHGDPHPGNFLFEPDGRIAFLDYGCVRHFEPAFVASMRDLLSAVIEEDRAAFREAVVALGVAPRQGALDEDALWDFFRVHFEPMIADADFSYDAEWTRRAHATMQLERLRSMSLPRELVIFNRITFGLNALFEQLGARANFHRIYQRYLDPAGNHPPALASVGVPLPARYLDAGRRSGPPAAA